MEHWKLPPKANTETCFKKAEEKNAKKEQVEEEVNKEEEEGRRRRRSQLQYSLLKRLERDCLGSEGVLLQSSQVDHGHGMAKPGGAEQVPQFSKAGEGVID